MKAIKQVLRQDKEPYRIPKRVQDVIPIKRIWSDGIFLVGTRYAKTFKFTDINYAVASREDKEAMFLEYSELLNSFDSGATTKITINNRRLNRLDFEKTILIPTTGDELDVYREEYNKMREKYTSLIDDTQAVVDEMSAERKQILEEAEHDMGWMEQFSKFRGIKELTREVVITLIDKVYIFADKRIKIDFNYRDEMAYCQELLTQSVKEVS